MECRVYRFTEKFASKVFDGIITATDHIQTLFPKEESIIVHNYPENKNKSLKRKNIIPNSLVYIGGLTPIRGIEEMLKAVVISRDKLPIEIHTYGQFTDMDYKKNQEEKLNELKEKVILYFLHFMVLHISLLLKI